LFYSEAGIYKGIMVKDTANEVCLSNVPQGEPVVAYLYFNQDGYSMYCKEYKEYWEWMEMRNDERYQVNQQHGQNYDAKNMMHTVRLLQSAKQIFENDQLLVRVSNREELLAIKAGNETYETLLEIAETLIQEIEKVFHVSKLQETPSKEMAEQTLIAMRNELYF
jgi:hypothetical protein